MTDSRPAFHYRVGWSNDYGRLFKREFSAQTEPIAVLDFARRTGRALLVGKGGSGKTTIVRRLAKAARDNGNLSYLINLKLWSPKLEREWENSEQSLLVRADLLLNELGDPRLSLSEFDDLKPDLTKFIIIDGLNEVRSRVAEQILAAADRLAGTILSLSVIVTDRLVRRETAQDRWSLAMVLPLEEEASRTAIEQALGTSIDWAKVTDSQKRLLENPFFLDKAIEEKDVGSTVAEVIERYISSHVGLSDEELSKAASGAYAMYRAAGARSFDVNAMILVTGADVFTKLVQAGVIEKEAQNAHFAHHLFHDYFAARHVASSPERWNYDTLNTISFNASSFDAVALVLQLLGAPLADDFIRRVYDWNPYAAAYAISDLEDDQVSDDLKFVFAVMLAERLSDIFAKTAERSADALSILGTSASKRLSGASHHQIQNLVADVNGQHDWFSEWKAVVMQPDGAMPEEQTMALLTSDDPILGWTAANVIRRQRPNEAQSDEISGLVNHSTSSPVRWRSAHVLGAFPTRENYKTLLRTLVEDEDEWVVYGALRSLLEIAARSTELRSAVVSGLEDHVELLYERVRLREEFARAVFARVDDPKSWLDGVALIIREFAYRAEDRTSFEGWVQVGDRLKEFLAA